MSDRTPEREAKRKSWWLTDDQQRMLDELHRFLAERSRERFNADWQTLINRMIEGTEITPGQARARLVGTFAAAAIAVAKAGRDLRIAGAYSSPIAKLTALRILALPYADHPDYREEWRP